MIKVFIVYDEEPDPEQYEEHAELCRKVEGGTYRHGKVFGAPKGEPRFRYYAEWDFPDAGTFKAAARTPEFAETGKHAMAMGIPFQVHFADVS